MKDAWLFSNDNFNQSISERHVTAYDMVDYAYPVTKYIRENPPDYAFACDRGGRLFGFAVFQLYQKLYRDGFPTRDRLLRFRHISSALTRERVMKNLELDFEELRRSLESPKILIIDDWVNSGGVVKICKDIFSEQLGQEVDLTFAAISGPSPIIAKIHTDAPPSCTWLDNPKIIGIDYDEGGSIPYITEPAHKFRKILSKSADIFVRDLKATESGVR